MVLGMLLKNNKYIKKNKYILFLIIIFNVPSSFAFDYFSYMDNLNSFSTFFKQNTYNDNGLLIKSSEGYLLYKKQSKYILEYKYPNIVKFVSDGNFITTYDEDLEQAIIQSTNNKEKNNIVDIMTNKKLIKKNFTLNTNTIDGEKHIKFKPIDNEIRNNVFLLVIKKNKIERITFMNDFDQSVTMIFKDFEKNIEVLDSSFKIDIPENFDVIIDK